MLMAQDPNSTIEALKAIPDLVWGGIIGVLGIIIGTFLSWIPVYFQLRHDSKERSISLLRDTYLSAAEKFGEQINYIANFYITQNNPPDGYIEAISKLNILGKDETIKAVNTLNDYLIKTMLELIPLKDRIDYLGTEAKNYEKSAQAAVLRSQKALKDMDEYNLQNVRDDSKWSLFQINFDLAQNDGRNIIEEFLKVNEEILKLTSELAENCQQNGQAAVELEIPIITSIRKELSTSFNEHAYREMMEISNMKWKQNLQEHIVSRKKVLDEFIEKWSSALSE